jgi:hypothetical protein
VSRPARTHFGVPAYGPGARPREIQLVTQYFAADLLACSIVLAAYAPLE